MIFAAGFGTRMAPLTDDRPKPLITVAGQSLLEHALKPAKVAGLEPIIVNAHYRAAQIKAALRGNDAQFAREETILETGGGLKAQLGALGSDPVFTMNSDAVWQGPNPYEILRATWDATKMDALLLCVPVDRALGRTDQGDFTFADDGQLIRGPGHVYCGAQIIATNDVARHPEDVFSLNTIWNIHAQRGTLFGVEYPGRWCDVGRPQSIPMAEAMLDV